MTYKQTYFFVAQSLTINNNKENKILIEDQLKGNNIDWDNVVKLSTAHFVLPALYSNYLKSEFIHYLPNDLVEFMKHLTELNRVRNENLMKEVKEINTLLIKQNIKPIFLKGISNLIQNLYLDNSDRMIGDIDFIVSDQEYFKVINLLKDFGYSTNKNSPPFHRHYPRMVKKNKIGAIEVHSELLSKKNTKYYNYSHIQKSVIKTKGFYIMDNQNQILYTILTHQLNDLGYLLNNLSLRKFYDFFLHSNKTDLKKKAKNNHKFKKPINSFYALCNEISLNSKFHFNKSKKTKRQVNQFYKILNNPEYRQKFNNRRLLIKMLQDRTFLIKNALFHKQYRKLLLNRINRKILKYLSMIF